MTWILFTIVQTNITKSWTEKTEVFISHVYEIEKIKTKIIQRRLLKQSQKTRKKELYHSNKTKRQKK